MPYKILWEDDCVTVEWSGIATYEENLDANGIIYGDKRFDYIQFQQSILLNADLSLFNLKNIKVIGKLDKQSAIWNKDLKVIHVATDPHILELISFWESTMQGSSWEFKTFKTIEAANAWIDKMRKSI